MLAVGGVVAKADTVVTTFDQVLASPNSTPANNSTNLSWANGSGNQSAQGGFTIGTENGIEVGLRAKYRQNPSVIDTPTDLYVVTSGPETTATSGTGQSAPTKAAWNYEFSIDLTPGGVSSGLTLSSISANSLLTITNLTTGHFATYNPFSTFPDNTGYGGTGLTTDSSHNTHSPVVGTDVVAQNSENAIFGTLPDYSLSGADLYEIKLDVINNDHVTLDSDTIDVQVTPLPSSATAGLALIAGLGVAAAVKRSRQVVA